MSIPLYGTGPPAEGMQNATENALIQLKYVGRHTAILRVKKLLADSEQYIELSAG